MITELCVAEQGFKPRRSSPGIRGLIRYIILHLLLYANTNKYKDVTFSPHFFPKGNCSHCSALWFWSIRNTTYCGNHHTSGQRASSFFLCNTMWFWLKTQPFMVQPGSGDRTGSLYLSCWSLGEWGANWINVCLPARSFNWGMVLRFKSGNRDRGKTGRKLVSLKAFPNGVRCHPQKEYLSNTVLPCPCRISN